MTNEKEFSYVVLKDFGTIEEPESGYDTRIKVVAWNGGKPKVDIRKWSKDNTKMAKGISLSVDAVLCLKELLNNINISDLENLTKVDIADNIDM